MKKKNHITVQSVTKYGKYIQILQLPKHMTDLCQNI